MELCTDRTLGDVEELQALSDRISKYGVDNLTMIVSNRITK